MSRARDSQGRFVNQGGGGDLIPSQAEDFVPQLGMERYLNRIDIPITFGAASNTEVFETVETGLQVELLGDTGKVRGLKWVVFGAILQPRTKTALATYLTTATDNIGIFAQILRGTHTALVDRDHEDCIGQCCQGQTLLTSGAVRYAFPWVFDFLGEQPVMAKRLTVGMVGISDAAELQLQEWVVSISWGVTGLYAADANALLQTRLLQD